MVLVGSGNIGQAVANYVNFEKLGFVIEGIFDRNPKLIGLKIRDIEVKDIDMLPQFLNENEIGIGIICVTSESAQNICDTLITGGVKGIWNFAPVDLNVPKNVTVENVHLSESLLTLSCLLNNCDSCC